MRIRLRCLSPFSPPTTNQPRLQPAERATVPAAPPPASRCPRASQQRASPQGSSLSGADLVRTTARGSAAAQQRPFAGRHVQAPDGPSPPRRGWQGAPLSWADWVGGAAAPREAARDEARLRRVPLECPRRSQAWAPTTRGILYPCIPVTTLYPCIPVTTLYPCTPVSL